MEARLMAWEWSHTEEAYRNVERHLECLSQEELITIWAEWCALADAEHYEGGFNEDVYTKTVEKFQRMRDPVNLPQAIYNRAAGEIQVGRRWYGRTCDNGGFNAWVCPYGCHTVPFDSPDEVEVDNV
jgi:hypothetical protein